MSGDAFTSVLDALLGIAFTIRVTVSGFMGDAWGSAGRHEKPLTIVIAFISMPVSIANASFAPTWTCPADRGARSAIATRRQVNKLYAWRFSVTFSTVRSSCAGLIMRGSRKMDKRC